MATVKRKAGSTGSININELVLMQANRSNVDIQTWRSAIQSAESITAPRRRNLLNLYDDLMLDGHLHSVIDKRRRAVRAIPISFLKGGKPIDTINDFLNSSSFRQMLTDLNDAKFYGHTLVQCDFSGEKLTYELIPRKHVSPEFGIVTVNESDFSGINYRNPPEFNYIIETGGSRNLGLLMPAAQYVIWKRGGMADWAELAELFGRPLRKGKYNPNDTAGKNALLDMLKGLGGAPYIAYPEGTDVTVDASGSNLTGDIYDRLKDACNAELSKLIVGSTLTSEAGTKGARALGEVHERSEADVFNEDRQDILSLLNNEFFKLLEIHGFPVAGGSFVIQDTEELPRNTQLDMLVKIKAMGVPVDDNYIYETFDIPRPADYDAQKAAAKKVTENSPGTPPNGGGTGQNLPGNDPTKVNIPSPGTNPVPPAPGKKDKKGKPSKPTVTAKLYRFFETLIGKANKMDEFTAKAQTEARRIAKMIYDNTLPDDFIVDEAMVSLITKYLIDAIEEGFGSITAYGYGTSRRALGELLIKNAFKFSAAKTEAMTRDMSAMMVGSDGNPLSYQKFKAVADSLNIQYNKNWMQTEWNTATSSGMMAEKWQGFVDNADVMPYLEYITVGDERVREDHAALNGTIRPVDDPFWDTFYPPLDWNCRCDVVQVTNPDAQPTDPAGLELPSVPEEFRNNPGKSGEVFTKNNPTMAGATDAALEYADKMASDYIDNL